MFLALGLLIIGQTINGNSLEIVSNYFHLSYNSDIPHTSLTASSLLESFNGSSFDKFTCLTRCNRNPACDVFALDNLNKSCRLYANQASVCQKAANSSNLIYYKIGTKLSPCCTGLNYYYDSNSTLCYYYDSAIVKNWNNSYSYCKMLGFSLVQLNSDKKFYYLYSYVTKYSLFIWVNSHTSIPLQFVWEDGSPITHWGAGEPNNSGGNSTFVKEGCLALFPNQIDDDDCSILHQFICEMPL